jgi:hypothetical protein
MEMEVCLRRAMLPPHIQDKLAELHGKGRGAHYRPSSVPPKRVTVDAGREAQQNRADVERRKPC